MSLILSLEEDNFIQIVPLIEKFTTELEAAAPLFQLEGRKLEEIMRTQPHYLTQYDRIHNEIKALEEWIQIMRDKVYARLWRKYNEGYSKALSTRDIQAYIGNEQELVTIDVILKEVQLLKSNANSIVEAIRQIGWMCGNITKLRIAELEDTIL